MLAGEAVVAIWNGIAEDARADFYAWHNLEHMPERVGIPGFLRGRRYAAADGETAPEFFTLYEAESFPVLTGSDYANRLNDPTEATARVTARFRDTRRALARVQASQGPGVGGYLLTLGLAPDAASLTSLARFAAPEAVRPRLTGVHLCRTDLVASGARSAESQGRSDISDPPAAFLLAEATDRAALAEFLSSIDAAGIVRGDRRQGVYRLEYLRTRTAFAV